MFIANENVARRGTIMVDRTTGEEHLVETLEFDADVVVFQRLVSRDAVEAVASAKAQGLRVVVDVDDDLDALHEGHPYREVAEGRRGEDWHAQNLHAACDLADVVTATTQPLVDRYAPGRGVVLPNLVPAEYLRVRARRKGPLRVGWTGRPISHIGDAGVMGGRVGPVVASAGAVFAAWGLSAPRTFAEVGVPVGHRVTVPHRPLRSGYPGSVAEMSVGLVPLVDSPFNRAKSWLKGIEYAALGVPFVASPLPEYRRLSEMGAGVLAETPEEWASAVGLMLAEPEYRAALVERGRAVVERLTYEAHAERWLAAWTSTSITDASSAMVVGGGDALSVPA